MTNLYLISLREDTPVQRALMEELRSFALRDAIVLDGPIELKDPLPANEALRLRKVAEILKEASRRKSIAEGLARTKAGGRRIGRKPVADPATTSLIVLARARKRSWKEIGVEVGLAPSTARRYYQKVQFGAQEAKSKKARVQEVDRP